MCDVEEGGLQRANCRAVHENCTGQHWTATPADQASALPLSLHQLIHDISVHRSNRPLASLSPRLALSMAVLRASLAVGSTLGCAAFTRQHPSVAACRQQRNVGTAATATRRQSLLMSSAAVAAGLLLSGSRSVAAAATSGGGDEAAAVLEDPQWPAEMPYRPEMFQRWAGDQMHHLCLHGSALLPLHTHTPRCCLALPVQV